MDFTLATWYPILMFLVVVLGFAVATLILCHLVGPRHTTPVKQMPYESGMDPIGTARQRYDVRFYLVAILFLVFDLELLFMYPWAVSAYRLFESAALKTLKTAIFWEMVVFMSTLAVAYLYAWRRGVFKWR